LASDNGFSLNAQVQRPQRERQGLFRCALCALAPLR
jgi:hypothetical protein